MKLQARLTLPLLLIGLATTAFIVLGIGFLIRYTFNGIFQSQGANIGNIALTVLESRTDQLNQVARQILDAPGPFREKASAIRTGARLVLAMEISGNRVTTAFGEKSELSCLAGLSDEGKHQPLIIHSGSSILIAGMARNRKTGRTVVVGQDIDAKFISALKELLRMDIRISKASDLEAGPGALFSVKKDFVPSTLTVPGPCGDTAITMMVPARSALVALRRALAWSVGSALLVLLLSQLLYMLLVSQVTRPIIELSSAVGKISAGDLTAKIPAGGPDELGVLVSRFNEMADSIKTSQERLVHSAKLASVGEMVAGISHELNNPLSGLIGQAEYLQTRLPPEDAGHEELQLILAEARRMKQTLAQLRGLIRPADAEKISVDLNHLVHDIFLLLRHETTSAGIKCDLSASTPQLMVRGVPDQLRQVLLNLALNSVQAMPQGGLIKIDTDLIMRDGQQMARIIFHDTGPGIPANLMERIFEPFFSAKPGNMGLGLAICREIIARHGGDIEATPGLTSGTTFTIHLPAGEQA
jgi:signal transduction histidine kinase